MRCSYIVDGKDIEGSRFVEALIYAKEFKSNKNEKEWQCLADRLPAEPKAILLSELLCGNTIGSIQNANWPQAGSVLVYLDLTLKNGYFDLTSVKYRFLNDPRYWYEEVTQVKDGVEHLIIT